MSKHCCATGKKVMDIPAPKGTIATTGYVQNYFCLDLLSMVFIVYCYLMKPTRGLCRPHYSSLQMFIGDESGKGLPQELLQTSRQLELDEEMLVPKR